MSETELELDLDELSSAEDFLDYFGVQYEPSIVHVNRLHILQRFHDYLAQAGNMSHDEAAMRERYTTLLNRAYEDFVTSDAMTEKVFKVFKTAEPHTAFVSLLDIK